QSNERRAIVGRDGTASALSSSDLISSAQTIKSKRVAHVSPATVNFYNTSLGESIQIGGHFLAPALAAITLNQSAAQPLTRRQVLGFAGTPVSTSNTQKNLEAESGLLVVEPVRDAGLR